MSLEKKMSLAVRLKKIMNDNKLNIKEFSLKCQIPYRTLQSYLSGEKMPGVGPIVKIGASFGINLNWLLAGEGPMYQNETREQKAEYKKKDEVERVIGWLKDWQNWADERKRHWLGVQMERTFPEYREWLDKQGL